MPHPPGSLPPSLAGRAFTVGEGHAAGLTREQMRRRSLRSPTRGVRATGDAPGRRDVTARCLELAPVLPADAVFCHITALALLGVDPPRGADPAGPLHVQTGPRSSRVRRPDVVAHRRADDAVATWRLRSGLRVLAPGLAWAQLATALPLGELVVAGDGLLRRRRPISTREELAAVIEGLPRGARGVRRLRDAFTFVRAGTDSPMETRLRVLLVLAGLPCPEVNVPVRDRWGDIAAMPDLSYPEQRVAIEYDGDVHRVDQRVWRRDIARRQVMESLGWRVITCTSDDVHRTPDRTASWVRVALARASTR
jgi:hypothetical protein